MQQKYTQNAQDGASFNYKFTPEKIDEFLEQLGTNGNISLSAKMVGMSRRAIYAFAKRDPSFREAMDNARAEAQDMLYYETWRRAVQGVEETLYYRGKPCGTVTRYSDKLLALLLRRQFGMPFSKDDDYQFTNNEDESHSATIVDDNLDLSKLTDEELNTFAHLIDKCSVEENISF